MIRVVPVEAMNKFESSTLMGVTGMKFTRITEEFIEGTMPVDHRTHQPMGLLHGGASVALAETLGSVGANLCVDQTQHHCVGLEINANHLSSVRSGIVTGVARPLHLGKSTQVWEIKITSDQGKLVCVSRLTMAVVPAKV
jgi:1,4-dihydroxy-2-naphthoyl-CoA hydrolase